MSETTTEAVAMADYPEIKPCEHMTGLVNQMADESLHGPALWYARFHVATCRSCAAALAALLAIRARLTMLTRTERSPQSPGLAANRPAPP